MKGGRTGAAVACCQLSWPTLSTTASCPLPQAPFARARAFCSTSCCATSRTPCVCALGQRGGGWSAPILPPSHALPLAQDDWEDVSNAASNGFHWAHGTERDTSGADGTTGPWVYLLSLVPLPSISGAPPLLFFFISYHPLFSPICRHLDVQQSFHLHHSRRHAHRRCSCGHAGSKRVIRKQTVAPSAAVPSFFSSPPPPSFRVQGTFDKQTTLKENTRIFAFNALVSSMQIYNIKSNLNDDILDVRSGAR